MRVVAGSLYHEYTLLSTVVEKIEGEEIIVEEERRKIQSMLRRNVLTNAWLINRLAKEGIITDKTEMSAVIHGARKGPKACRIINVSLSILEEYERKMEVS